MFVPLSATPLEESSGVFEEKPLTGIETFPAKPGISISSTPRSIRPTLSVTPSSYHPPVSQRSARGPISSVYQPARQFQGPFLVSEDSANSRATTPISQICEDLPQHIPSVVTGGAAPNANKTPSPASKPSPGVETGRSKTVYEIAETPPDTSAALSQPSQPPPHSKASGSQLSSNSASLRSKADTLVSQIFLSDSEYLASCSSLCIESLFMF